MIIRRKLCLIYRLVTKNPLTGFHEPCISNCPTHNRWIIVFRKSYYASLRNYFTNTNDKKINRTIVRNVIVTRNQQTQKTNLFRPNNRSSLKCYEKKKEKSDEIRRIERSNYRRLCSKRISGDEKWRKSIRTMLDDDDVQVARGVTTSRRPLANVGIDTATTDRRLP